MEEAETNGLIYSPQTEDPVKAFLDTVSDVAVDSPIAMVSPLIDSFKYVSSFSKDRN